MNVKKKERKKEMKKKPVSAGAGGVAHVLLLDMSEKKTVL